MTDRPVIVLVHGAWGSPAMWDDVIAALPPGQAVLVADLPTTNRSGTSLADDAAHVRDLTGDRAAVLVGHSYGGSVITEAGSMMPGVEHLVYLAACMPDVGESMVDWVMKRPAAEPVPMEVYDDGTSLLILDEDHLPYDPVTNARLLAIGMRRFAIAGITTPSTAAAWHTVPSSYVVASQDTMIHPDTQREMAVRASTVAELDAEHQVILSHPAAVASLIVEAQAR